MRRAALLLLSLVGLGSGAQILAPTGRTVRGEYIILLHQNATDTDQHEVYVAAGGVKKFSIGSNYKAIHAKLSADQLSRAASHLSVDRIEHNQVITTATHKDSKLNCPNHQQEPLSWGQKRITTSSPRDVLADFAHDANWGSGVDAYIIDTGVRCTHKEFLGRCIWGTNTAGGTDSDVNGHGTHCAGTVAGSTYGVSKSATIIAVKVLGDSGSGTTAGVIAGVEWVAGNVKTRKRPSVANMSLGGGFSASLNSAVNAAVKEGTSFAIAAGNENKDACNYSPASSSDGVTVGSVALGSDGISQVDSRSSFSNYGTCTDIFAPGSSIIAAYATSDTSYATLSGTSMASPHVAGAMAALLTNGPLTPSVVKETLIGSASKGILNIGTGSPDRMLHLQCQ
eukprot:TRINITY_DN1675_c0_g1_i1.p1 TRINITY_DN1675_c0_g1~~TRINITY_DN1675_c0_g1_i1.p1  ORF type:complete len:396 (+),score=76.98 TRINITY_DN1675_c0_g1_i1:92-1279(+)